MEEPAAPKFVTYIGFLHLQKKEKRIYGWRCGRWEVKHLAALCKWTAKGIRLRQSAWRKECIRLLVGVIHTMLSSNIVSRRLWLEILQV